MTFDQRFNNSMRDINIWTQSPPNTDLPGVDTDARRAVVALQAQVEALQRAVATVHGWMIADEGANLRGSAVDTMMMQAMAIRAPEFAFFPAEDTSSELVDAYGEDVACDDAGNFASSGRKARQPRVQQPTTMDAWLAKLSGACDVALLLDDLLYRHLRFEQPKLIILTGSEWEHKAVVDWMHSKVLDCAFQYGTEEGTDQNWAAVPIAALVELGLAIPDVSQLRAG